MEAPPLQPPLDHIVSRQFSFFPPIVGVETNDWTYRQSTWSEILVANSQSGQEIWIPRRYFGDVSRIEEPVLIVGLTRELEYSGGMLHPFKQRLVKMPSAFRPHAAVPGENPEEAVKPFMGLRLERNDKRIIKMLGIALAGAILLYAFAVTAMRVGDVRGRRVVFTTPDQAYENLTARDDRLAVVTKLGAPGYDRFRERGTIQFEALTYPARKYTIILMGTDTRTVVYIGTMDDRWKPVHYVPLHAGGDTESLLRSIERF